MEHNGNDISNSDAVSCIEIRRICAKNAIILDDTASSRLIRFAQLLREWNAKLNLISRKDMDNLWDAHVLHSLSILFEINIPQSARILDLGTGGGLPGVPLKIVRPDLDMTLLDATRKKVDAVREMISGVGCANLHTQWGRAEDAAVTAALGRSFDVVVARAVAPLADLIRWSGPFIDRGADRPRELPHLVALKGVNLAGEVDQVYSRKLATEVRSKALTFAGSERIPGTEKKIVSVFL